MSGDSLIWLNSLVRHWLQCRYLRWWQQTNPVTDHKLIAGTALDYTVQYVGDTITIDSGSLIAVVVAP